MNFLKIHELSLFFLRSQHSTCQIVDGQGQTVSGQGQTDDRVKQPLSELNVERSVMR